MALAAPVVAGTRETAAARPFLPLETANALRQEHRLLLPRIDSLRELADSMYEIPSSDIASHLDAARQTIRDVRDRERRDGQRVYTGIAATMQGEDPLAAMSRTHQEIFHLARSFERARWKISW